MNGPDLVVERPVVDAVRACTGLEVAPARVERVAPPGTLQLRDVFGVDLPARATVRLEPTATWERHHATRAGDDLEIWRPLPWPPGVEARLRALPVGISRHRSDCLTYSRGCTSEDLALDPCWREGSCGPELAAWADLPHELPREVAARVPAPGACLAGTFGFGSGAALVLGREVVVLAPEPAAPGRLAVAGRFPLPADVRGWAADARQVAVESADGAWTLVDWTADRPVATALAGVIGPVRALAASVVVLDDALVGVGAEGVRWRTPFGTVLATRVHEGAVWVLSGEASARIVAVDPVTGGILTERVVEHPPLGGSFEGRAGGVEATVRWSEPIP